MVEYIATNIDDVGVASRNTHIRHHTITERMIVNIPDKHKNSNLGTSVSESNIRVDHCKYTENNCCQEKFGESPNFSFDLDNH
jgi:hypothetical protein